MAIRIAAVEEATCFSPAAIIGNGIAISATAKASSQRPRPRRLGSVPARQATASSTTAPSATRSQARSSGGMPPSSAILMKR